MILIKQTVYTVPKNWELIPPKEYPYYSIMDTEDGEIDNVYLAPNVDGEQEMVFVRKIIDDSSLFLELLEQDLCEKELNPNEVDEISEYIRENHDDEDDDLESIYPVYHEYNTISGWECYVTIIKITLSMGMGYSFEIFVPYEDDVIYSFQATTDKINENDPLQSICKKCIPVAKIIKEIIPSIASAKA